MVSEFTTKAMWNLPVETEIVTRVMKAMEDNGTPVNHVWDGEEYVRVHTRDDILEAVFSVDMSRMCFIPSRRSGVNMSYVLIVLGNEEDALADYTMDLETALQPVHEYIDTIR